MSYLKLFLTFFKIGAVSFGGGYGMISLIREEVLSNGWLEEEDLLNMIAVSESTPGPIAVNMATFIGSKQGGITGSMVATLGVILPSFIIILLIAALIRNLLKYKGVQGFLNGVRPCIIGLILATALNIFITTILNISTLSDFGNDYSGFNIRGFIILIMIIAISLITKYILQKKSSPIMMIIISAILGMIVYSV
ncbi:MAG: chromate transporter [Lachnospiraceae bacterium]|nr:chromate transporter [Lachnospiraceae bacterium]